VSDPVTNKPDTAPTPLTRPILVSTEAREGETRQQANERIAARMLSEVDYQMMIEQARANLRNTGHTEEEIEELSRIY